MLKIKSTKIWMITKSRNSHIQKYSLFTLSRNWYLMMLTIEMTL